MYRDRILDLHHDGLSERQIAREVRVSHTYVGKVIKRYDESNTDLRAQRSHFVKPKVDQTVSEYIECCRLLNPSIYESEIRQRLLLDGVVHPVDIPSVSQINSFTYTTCNDKEENSSCSTRINNTHRDGSSRCFP